jgi:hypothetical protein
MREGKSGARSIRAMVRPDAGIAAASAPVGPECRIPAFARKRRNEPRHSLESVVKELRCRGKLWGEADALGAQGAWHGRLKGGSGSAGCGHGEAGEHPRPVGSVKLATSDSSYLAAPLDLQRAAELELANACERVARADGRRRIVECIDTGRGGPGVR